MVDSINEAQEYDLFDTPADARQGCEFLQAVFAAHEYEIQKILDVACGTGRHAVEMANRGYDVTGVDFSPAMLAVAEQKAAAANVLVTFRQRDITALDFAAEFDAAYILFNTIELLTGNDELVGFMNGLYTALKPNGLFVIELTNLWSVVANGRLTGATFRWSEAQGGINRERRVETIIGPYNNIMRHEDNKQYWKDEQKLASRMETVYTRVFSLNELDLLCRLTGFQRKDLFGAVDISARIEKPDEPVKMEHPYKSYVLVLQKQQLSISKRRMSHDKGR